MIVMTVEEAVCDMVRTTREAGRWEPGDRFWVQVRAYTPDAVLLRFFTSRPRRNWTASTRGGRPPGLPVGKARASCPSPAILTRLCR